MCTLVSMSRLVAHPPPYNGKSGGDLRTVIVVAGLK